MFVQTMRMMRCERCGNTNPRYFYRGSKGLYCRRCIRFSRILLEEEVKSYPLREIAEGSEEYLLRYPLSEEQRNISHQCCLQIRNSEVLIEAVTGAGKTEIVLETIASFLAEKKRVCFAIPRRQVVLELAERFREIFIHAQVSAVCGGHTECLDGDLIVCTTHQLYRYPGAFDCLILDEPDAFPYKGDEVLHGIARNACRGNRIFLTATPDEELKTMVEKGKLARLVLHHRPHGYPLPVPVVKTLFLPGRVFVLVRWLKTHTDVPCIVFAPTIRMAYLLERFLHIFFKTYLVTSKSEKRDEIIEAFRFAGKGVCVATTVLERGVTFTGCSVCVYQSSHAVFDEASLTQMAGRAGRKFEAPTGDVLFLQKEKSEVVEACVRSICKANSDV